MLYHGLQQMKWNVYVNKLTIEVAHCQLKPLETYEYDDTKKQEAHGSHHSPKQIPTKTI